MGISITIYTLENIMLNITTNGGDVLGLLKFTKANLDYIRNLPSNVQAELIILEDVIPDDLLVSLYVNDPFFKKERSSFLNYRPDLLKKMYQARGYKERLVEEKRDNRINIDTDENVEFIKKYPQYKQLISGIIFRDDNSVEEFVPIDQYLAEN